MMFVPQSIFLLAAINTCVYGQHGLPFQVNSRRSCATQISIDTATLTGIKRGDENAPCSGYLLYSNGGTPRRMCSHEYYALNDFSAQRACYTLGINVYRDSTTFVSSRTRQMQLYECFSYKEQNADSAEEGEDTDVFYAYYNFMHNSEGGCTDEQSDPSAYDCFDTCYFTSPNYGAPFATTEDACVEGDPFYSIGCSDINECLNGVRDYCTGPFDTSCTIRTACGNNTDCTNHPGSFECSCKNGYEYRSGDSFDPYDLNEGCKDVDECAESKCDVNAKCVNTPGTYICLCRDGFAGDGKTCTPITCSSLPKLPNTKYKFPVQIPKFGDTVVCECDKGYKVSVQNLPENLVNYYGYTTTDSFTLTCDEKGDWGPYSYPQCIPIDCGDPGMIPNAERDGTGFMLNQKVTYTCEDGFNPENYGTIGSFTRRCQADGTWTNGMSCVDVDECQQLDVCSDDQHCVNIKGSYLCFDGFPDNCDIQGFCKNGECKLIHGRAKCVCNQGYVGLRCEIYMSSTALIIASVALVLFGLLIIIHLVVLCMRRTRHPNTHPPEGVVSPVVVGRAQFPTKAFGFRRPLFALRPTATCDRF